MEKREPSSKFHVGSKYRTLPANPYLLAPAILNFPPADGSIDEPAEVSRFEFPRRAFLTSLRRTTPNFPAGSHVSVGLFFNGPQKEHLPFDVHRNSSPPLFEALNAPERRSQEVGHFLLGFLKFLTKRPEFFGVRGFPLEGYKKFFYLWRNFFLTAYITLCYKSNHFFISLFWLPPLYPKKIYFEDLIWGESFSETLRG